MTRQTEEASESEESGGFEAPFWWLIPPYQWTQRWESHDFVRIKVLRHSYAKQFFWVVFTISLAGTYPVLPFLVAWLFGISVWTAGFATVAIGWFIAAGFRVQLNIVDGAMTVWKKWWFVPYARRYLGENWRVHPEHTWEDWEGQIEIRRHGHPVVAFGSCRYDDAICSAIRRAASPSRTDARREGVRAPFETGESSGDLIDLESLDFPWHGTRRES